MTGAAGFIGSHLVGRLLNDGHTVVGIDDGRTGDWSRLDSRCSIINQDLTRFSADEFEKMLEGVDTLFHLAAEKYNSSKVTPQKVIAVNVDATQKLFDSAGRVGVRRVVFTSSLYAYGSLGPEDMSELDLPAPITVYGASKVMGEHLLRCVHRDHGLSWAVARPFFVYGPRQFAQGGYKSVIVKNFERMVAGELPIVNGDGKQSLDYVYIDDVVEGLIRLSKPDADGVTVNLGSGMGIAVNDLTTLMLDIADLDIDVQLGPADWTAGTRRVGNIFYARDRLGWKAEVKLESGLARVWNWMQEQNS